MRGGLTSFADGLTLSLSIKWRGDLGDGQLAWSNTPARARPAGQRRAEEREAGRRLLLGRRSPE
jgi:hypothetical protein